MAIDPRTPVLVGAAAVQQRLEDPSEALEPTALMAAALERWDESFEHFEFALAQNQRASALPSLAHTHHEFAVALLARGGRGDAPRARSQLAQSTTIARQLGMTGLLRKIEAG